MNLTKEIQRVSVESGYNIHDVVLALLYLGVKRYHEIVKRRLTLRKRISSN